MELRDLVRGIHPSVLTDRGPAIHADLVVDSTGRRSALGSWLTAAGARPPAVERADSGWEGLQRARQHRGCQLDERDTVQQAADRLAMGTLEAPRVHSRPHLVLQEPARRQRLSPEVLCW